MQSGRLLLSGLTITVCLGLITGCTSTPKKTTKARTEQVKTKTAEVKHEYIIKYAPQPSPVVKALPLKRKNYARKKTYSAEKQRQERLRLQRQKEWEIQQAQDKKREEYRRKWAQKEALTRAKAQQVKSQKASYQRQSQAQQQAQQQAQLKRQQYQQQWQQQQAKREQYHQQWQQQQQARQRQQASRQQAQQRQQASRQQAQQRQQVRPRPQQQAQVRVTGYGGQGVGNYRAAYLSGDFAGQPALLRFIDKMSARHGFSKAYLNGVFSRTRNRDSVARLWAGNNGGSSSGGRGWYNYRSKFVTAANAQKGAKFWRKHQAHLIRASRQYGVDPEYIVGIMGVETRWGRILGKHKVIDALTTSALVNKRRSKFFFKELENYLLMTRSERMDPLAPKGSYAGAMGYGQFMPSSFRAFAVDFNGDGVRDLWNPVDAIGSVANYFAKHGWKSGQEVVVPAKVTSMKYTSMPDGYKVKYSPKRLAKKGIRPRSGRWSRTGRTHLLALTTVPGGLKEPWIGYHNFYVITRYNHSNYYAMAVHQLAQEVKRNVGGGKYASR